MRQVRGKALQLFVGLALAASGCTTSSESLSDPHIRRLLLPPELPPPPAAPAHLPAAPSPPAAKDSPAAGDDTLPPPRPLGSRDVLLLPAVLASVEEHFPLLLAVQQERAIAAGQRRVAEGAFDLNLRSRGVVQGGTFPSERFDLGFEQPSPLGGVSLFSGYRFGFGDFPVYYGDRLTADGGEFRGGVVVPLLRDSAIDRRRAALRQAQIQQAIADPAIQRARIDYFRAAARAYWHWVAAGAQYSVADALLRLARTRQAGFERQFELGQVSEFVVIDNRRLIAEREGTLIAAERRFQQTALDLSLFVRDGHGDPVVPCAAHLPENFLREPPPPLVLDPLPVDIERAYGLRPELQRFALLKERAAVDLQLAKNQTWPTLNATVAGAQDVGKGKVSPGIFALDRSVAEGSLLLDVPLQRREATGRVRIAEATLAQLLAQERFARDQIGAEVQDAVSNLERSLQRHDFARQEQAVAQRVAELERERFQKGQSNLLEVNLRELAAAGAQAKVIDTLAEYFRAHAEYRAALGLDGKPADGAAACVAP